MYLFIDTNIIKSSQYDFKHGYLAELNRYIKERYVTLVLTSVLEAEYRRHCDTKTKIIYDKYQALQKEFDRYGIQWPLESIQGVLNEAIYSPLEAFLTQSENVKLKLSTICVDSIVEDYRYGRPPFTNSKNDEFKDAINIHLLKQFQETIPEPIHIISSDIAFGEALGKNNHDFIVHNNISDFVSLVRMLRPVEKNIGALLTKYFDSKDFQEQIITSLENRENYKAVDYDICIQRVESVTQLKHSFALAALAEKEGEGILYINGLAYILFTNVESDKDYIDDFGDPIEIMFRGQALINTSIPFKVQFEDSLEHTISVPSSIINIDIDWSKLNINVTKNRMKEGSVEFYTTFKLSTY